VQALCFSLGLASSLAALGVVSAGVGRAYGQIGSGLPSAVALLAVLMGLNLLEVRGGGGGGGQAEGRGRLCVYV